MKTNKLFSTQIQSFAHVLCNPFLRRGLHIIGQFHSLFDQTFLQTLQRGRSQCLYEAQIQNECIESVLAELPITPRLRAYLARVHLTPSLVHREQLENVLEISAASQTHREQRLPHHAEGGRRHQLLRLLQHVQQLLHRLLRGGLRRGDGFGELRVEGGAEGGGGERGDVELLHEEHGAFAEMLLQLSVR